MDTENNPMNFNTGQPMPAQPTAQMPPMEPMEPVAPMPMKEPKKKTPTWVMMLLMMIMGVLVGVGGYMLVDMLISKTPECPECPECPTITQEASITNTLTFKNGLSGIAVVYEGVPYVHISDFERDWPVYGENAYQTFLNTQETYVSFELDGTLFTFGNDIDGQFMGVKLDTENVIGLAEQNGLVMLYDDGAVGFISAKDLVSGLSDVTALEGVAGAVKFDTCPIDGDPANGASLCVATEEDEMINLDEFIAE